MPAAYQSWLKGKNKRVAWDGFMAAPASKNDLSNWHKATASGFDMGTLYTMVAGLLNILVVFDAYAGPLPPPVPKKRRKREKEEADGSTDQGSLTGTSTNNTSTATNSSSNKP